VSIESNTLLYGARDLDEEELSFQRRAGALCQRCDIAPTIFLANPMRLREAGSWPVRHGPWARLSFFLRNLGQLKIKRCTGMAAFTRPPKLSVPPQLNTYNLLSHVATTFKFVRIMDGHGNVRWMGCARDSNTCRQEYPSDPPIHAWDVVCCAHLVHTALLHIRDVVGTTRWRWQLWGSTLLGVTRDSGLLPWKAEGAVAFSSAAISSLHIRLTGQAVSKHGSFALTSLDKGSGFRLLYAVPPPIYIHGAQSAWRESNKALRHHILTGTGTGTRNTEASLQELKTAIHNFQPKCKTTASEPTCQVIHTPAALQVVVEPGGREKVAVGRVTLRDGHDPWRWPVPQDAPPLLRKWYGFDWSNAKCDWGTGAGVCH